MAKKMRSLILATVGILTVSGCAASGAKGLALFPTKDNMASGRPFFFTRWDRKPVTDVPVSVADAKPLPTPQAPVETVAALPRPHEPVRLVPPSQGGSSVGPSPVAAPMGAIPASHAVIPVAGAAPDGKTESAFAAQVQPLPAATPPSVAPDPAPAPASAALDVVALPSPAPLEAVAPPLPLEPVAPPPPPPLPEWTMRRGETLMQKLTEWALTAGWNPPFPTPTKDDWVIDVTPPPFVGSFEDAVTYLADGFQYAKTKPRVVLSQKSKSILVQAVN